MARQDVKQQGGHEGAAQPVELSTGHSLRRFLERTLPSRRRQKLHDRFPAIMAEVMAGELDDDQIAQRILDGDEALLWVLHVILHTNGFVKVMTWRCRSFCGRPCHPPSLKDLPCEWSERILWDFFVALTPISDSRPLLRDFLRYAPEGQGLVEWLNYKLHYNYHYQRLREAGFIPPEPSRMPRSIRGLADKDPGYRLIWVHRWYWGNDRLDSVAALMGLSPDDPGLHRMVEEVDRAFLTSREVKSLTTKYKGLVRQRRDCGIPPRFEERE